MSELLQSGPHPDADQLNAFVEHALPEHERQATLAHLAICTDCRAVVALSLPPFEETLPQPEPLARRWFFGWKLIWPAATVATIAVLAGVSIYIRNVSIIPIVRPAPQVAANHAPPPPPPVGQPQPSEPKQKPTATPAPASPSSQRSSAQSAAKPATAPLPLQGRDIAKLEALPPSVSSATASGAAMETTTTVNGASFTPDHNAAAVLPLQAAPAAGTVAAAPQAAPMDAPQTTAVAGIAENASLSPPATFAVHKMALLDLASAILRMHPLPNGVPALSIVTDIRQQQTVAIDIHGSIFLTADFGEHWTPVAAQWPGRAVKVDLAYSGATHGMGMLGSLASKPGSAFAPQAGSTAGPVAISGGVALSSLGGTVTDASGAIIPGTTVIVSASPTQLARMAKADATGHYLIDGLVPGTYTAEATSPGFTRLQLNPIVLEPGEREIADLKLAVGASAQTVTVDAAAPQMELDEPEARKKSPAPATASAPVFEITTDTGEHWVSPDGQNWKQK